MPKNKTTKVWFIVSYPALKKKWDWPYWPERFYLTCITFLKTKQKWMLPVVCYKGLKPKPKDCTCRKG